MLVPAKDQDQADTCEVVQEIRELRKGACLGKETIRELIDEGRRY